MGQYQNSPGDDDMALVDADGNEVGVSHDFNYDHPSFDTQWDVTDTRTQVNQPYPEQYDALSYDQGTDMANTYNMYAQPPGDTELLNSLSPLGEYLNLPPHKEPWNSQGCTKPQAKVFTDPFSFAPTLVAHTK